MNTEVHPRLFRAESVRRSLGVYLPTTFAYRFIGLLRGVVLTWLMAESEFGLFQITLLTINILNPLCSAGLNEAIARYVPQYETKHALRPFLARTIPLVLVVSLFLSGTAYLTAGPLGRLLFAALNQGGNGFMNDTVCVTLMRLSAGTTFALIGYFLLLSILKGLRMFKAVSLMELVNNLAFTLLAIIVALRGWNTAGAILACYGVTLAFAVLLFGLPLSRVISGSGDQSTGLENTSVDRRNRSIVNQMLRFSVWAALAAVMWQTLLYYPMWYLQKVHGPEATAVFGGVRHITQVVLIAAVAVVTVVQTSVTKIWESRGPAAADQRLSLAFKTTALLLLMGCAALAASAKLLIRLFPHSYMDGSAIIPLSLLFFFIGGHLTFLAIHFTVIEKTRHLFWPWTIGVVCTAAFGQWLVQPHLEIVSALRAAVWAGILGISAALITSLCLIRAERRPLDLGSCLLIASTYCLALPIGIMVLIVAAILVLTWGTSTVFTNNEKRQLNEYVATGRDKIRQLFRPSTK